MRLRFRVPESGSVSPFAIVSTAYSRNILVLLVTGTSSGIGRTLVQLILEKGENVAATARSPAALDDLAQTYPPTRLLVLRLDVTQPDQIIDAFSAAKKAFGRIDVVVSNAGWGDLGEVEAMDERKGRGLLETNFWGALHVSKEAIRFFRDDNPPGIGGRLLSMSSYLGLSGFPAAGYYVASKFGEPPCGCAVANTRPDVMT